MRLVDLLLLSGRIITEPEESLQWREPSRLIQLHKYLSIFSVAFSVFRGVPENVLVAKLDANLSRDIGQFRHILNRIGAASRLLSQICQQPWSGSLFRSSSARTHGFVDADRKD